MSEPLAALAMRERAAEVAIKRKGIGADTMPHPYDDGYLAACDECARAIRALSPTFTNAELLDASMQLPEVRALVSSAEKALQHEGSVFYGPQSDQNSRASFNGVTRQLRKALVPFMKGGDK